MTTDPTPEPVDFHTVPPPIAPVARGWQAWWENNDMWDGFLLYADLDTAKRHAAVDYIGEEYGWVPGNDPADEAPDVKLTWVFERTRWYLLDNAKGTDVQLYESATYGSAANEIDLRDRVAKALAGTALKPPFPHCLAAADAVLAMLPDQAAALGRIREVVRRLAAHAVGFQDVLDDSDRAPWARTVGADITELCEVLDAPAAPVLPASADRAAVLREAADECDTAGAAYTARAQNDHAAGAFALMETFLRKANEVEYAATPCSVGGCEPGGEPCSTHERLMAHGEGDHELCEPNCGPELRHCPTPETHNWGCGCPSDVAAAVASCPGRELDGPSPCRCPCEGCKHHCGAHETTAPAAVAQTIPCNAAHLRVHHAPHGWEPQPGMEPIPCTGYPEPNKEA